MKMLIFKAILAVLIAVGAGNYLGYLQTGQLPFDFDSLSLPELPFDLSIDLPNELPIELPEIPFTAAGTDKAPATATTDRVYKWVDENGVIQLSSFPPADLQGVESVEVVEVNPNTNVIQSERPVLMREPESDRHQAVIERSKGGGESGQGTNHSQSGNSPSIYSPTQVKKLMDDAKSVQKLLNERFENQRQVIEGM